MLNGISTMFTARRQPVLVNLPVTRTGAVRTEGVELQVHHGLNSSDATAPPIGVRSHTTQNPRDPRPTQTKGSSIKPWALVSIAFAGGMGIGVSIHYAVMNLATKDSCTTDLKNSSNKNTTLNDLLSRNNTSSNGDVIFKPNDSNQLSLLCETLGIEACSDFIFDPNDSNQLSLLCETLGMEACSDLIFDSNLTNLNTTLTNREHNLFNDFSNTPTNSSFIPKRCFSTIAFSHDTSNRNSFADLVTYRLVDPNQNFNAPYVMNENRYTCVANRNGTQCWGFGFNRTIDPEAYSFKGTQTQQDVNNIVGYQKFSRCTSKSFSTLPFNQTYETLNCFETQTISSSQTAHADSTISSSKRLTSEYGFVEAYVNKIGKNIQQRFWERNGFTIDALVDGSCKPEDIFHNVTRVTSETMEHGTIVNRPTSRPEPGYQLLLKNPLQAGNANTANQDQQENTPNDTPNLSHDNSTDESHNFIKTGPDLPSG